MFSVRDRLRGNGAGEGLVSFNPAAGADDLAESVSLAVAQRKMTATHHGLAAAFHSAGPAGGTPVCSGSDQNHRNIELDGEAVRGQIRA
jgi:hypothetical protein